MTPIMPPGPDVMLGTWPRNRCRAAPAVAIRMRDSGAADSVRREFDWVARHRDELAAPLR